LNRLSVSEDSEQYLSLAGMSVIGFDTSARTVESLNSGHSHIDDLSDDDVNAMLGSGFTATTHPVNLAGW
jgi:UDP-N-acetyl-D-glucosamine dehydrogenase